MRQSIALTVNGSPIAREVEARTLLVYFLREELGLTGTHVGCDTSSCGACTVHLDGEAVKSCTVLAVQADGSEVTTIEGLAANGLHPMQQAFHEQHALQCGYCTPGMIMSATHLLARNPNPTEDEIRHGLEGNLCRCTGYQNIVDAVSSPPRGRRSEMATADELPRASARARAQGGRAADHRPGPLRRRHQAAGHAARRVRALAVRIGAILSIDTAEAEALPGVVRILTAETLGLDAGVPCASNPFGDAIQVKRPILAEGRVRMLGEPVALVVAATARRRATPPTCSSTTTRCPP